MNISRFMLIFYIFGISSLQNHVKIYPTKIYIYLVHRILIYWKPIYSLFGSNPYIENQNDFRYKQSSLTNIMVI